MKRQLIVVAMAGIIGLVLCGGASAVRIEGQVFLDSAGDEEAPCCMVTLWEGDDCTEPYLAGTATDSCGSYVLDYDCDPLATYYVKVHFQIMACAAWYGYGTCPETVVCDDVTTGTGSETIHDVYLGLDECYNSGCD